MTTFSLTGGQQTYTVPAGVNTLTVECWGAQGGGGAGGKGAYIKATLAVTAGETLYINVGGQGGQGLSPGWNGGGSTPGSGVTTPGYSGGGMSDVRQGGTGTSAIKVAAAGGGGASGGGDSGGVGGITTGGDGAGSGTNSYGRGGTQTTAGASSSNSNGFNGTYGTQWAGGSGGAGGGWPYGGGGGGGGYYGGGGGEGGSTYGSGGGGSSYTGGVTVITAIAGSRFGNGLVVITDNRPPNAPSWVTPQNSIIPADQDAYLEIAFSDPDTGDTMSASNWKRWTLDVNGARVAGSLVTTYQPTPSTKLLIPAGTLTAGTKYEFQADTVDSKGAEGPYGSSLFITAQNTPAQPTWLDPISGQTIGTSSYTGKISAPNVDVSEWTLYADDGAGNIDTNTVLQGPDTVAPADGDVRQHTFTGLANNVPVWWSVRVKYQGLWSQPTQIRTPVSYTPPPTPQLAFSTDSAAGMIDVTITNPPPGTVEPALSYNDLYVRSPASAPNADKYRPYSETGNRIGTLLAGNATFVDRIAASGVAYEYQVIAVATNGTTSSSGWIPLG